MTWARIRCRCVEDGDCLLWDGSVDRRGFPRFNIKVNGKPKTYQVRRLAWELKNGRPVPAGMKVTSTCGHRLCLQHLDLITHGEAVSKAANQPQSIARRIANGLKMRAVAKLDMEKARYIRESTKTTVELAGELGVSFSQAARIRRGEAWKEYSNPFAGLLG